LLLESVEEVRGMDVGVGVGVGVGVVGEGLESENPITPVFFFSFSGVLLNNLKSSLLAVTTMLGLGSRSGTGTTVSLTLFLLPLNKTDS